MKTFKNILALVIYVASFVAGLTILSMNFDLKPVGITIISVIAGIIFIAIGARGLINDYIKQERVKRQRILDLIDGSDTILNLTKKQKIHYIVLSDYIIGLYHDQQLDSFDREYLIRQKVEELIEID